MSARIQKFGLRYVRVWLWVRHDRETNGVPKHIRRDPFRIPRARGTGHEAGKPFCIDPLFSSCVVTTRLSTLERTPRSPRIHRPHDAHQVAPHRAGTIHEPTSLASPASSTSRFTRGLSIGRLCTMAIDPRSVSKSAALRRAIASIIGPLGLGTSNCRSPRHSSHSHSGSSPRIASSLSTRGRAPSSLYSAASACCA
jgi:hypothetical protein